MSIPLWSVARLQRALAITGLAAAAFASCTSTVTPTTPSSAGVMDASQWVLAYSPGMPKHPLAADTGWEFQFPEQDGVHYLTTSQRPTSMAQSITATISVSTTGGPTFEYRTEAANVCDSPAKVRLFFQRAGDDLSGQGQYEFYRWWNINAAYTLAPGTITLVGDLTDLSQWSSVLGKTGDANAQMFRGAMANVGAVGFTFGGGCFYGHGVYVQPNSGQAVFKALDYVVR